MSHAGFLREHHDGDEEEIIVLIRGLLDGSEAAAGLPLADGVQALCASVDGWVAGSAFEVDAALIRYVVKLALAPRHMRASDVRAVREAGLSDRDIHDVVNVVACFSYMNRLADGLGVTSDYAPGSWAERLMGAERLAAHRAWAAGS